jgi:hypothetical protein
MQDKIDLELKRLLTDSGASEDFWQQVEIWQREADETEDSATDGETDAELQRQIELWQQDETDEAGQIETGAEFLRQILQQVEIWQRADEENEPARLEAEQRAARELDELVERFRNE